MSDRLTGLVLLALALAYGFTARGFEAQVGDPLGPAVFPQVLAVPLVLLSLYLLVRPDPEPEWARGRPLVLQGLGVAVLVAYAYLLEPLGFIVATAIGVTALATLLGARAWRAAATGAAVAVVLFFLFNNLLSLPLPAGVLAWG